MERNLLVIVDDEEDILDLLKYNFTIKGFEVETFSEAKGALAFVQERRPDVILCDWMMPGMNGLDLCREIKANHGLCTIPFIMVTCRNERTAITQAYSEGVTDYIVKPVKLLDLIARVQALLIEKSTKHTQA